MRKEQVGIHWRKFCVHTQITPTLRQIKQRGLQDRRVLHKLVGIARPLAAAQTRVDKPRQVRLRMPPRAGDVLVQHALAPPAARGADQMDVLVPRNVSLPIAVSA
jgi:hypothetical protein